MSNSEANATASITKFWNHVVARAFFKSFSKLVVDPGDRGSNVEDEPQTSTHYGTRTGTPDLSESTNYIPGGMDLTEDYSSYIPEVGSEDARTRKWHAEQARLLEEIQMLRGAAAERERSEAALETHRAEIEEEQELLVKQLLTEHEALSAELEETKRLLAIFESRQKIVQLESERPLWEAARRERELKEKEEEDQLKEQRRQAGLAESRRKMREFMAQEAAWKRAKVEESRRRAMEEEERRLKEEAARKAAEQEERAREEEERLAELRRKEQWRLAAERETTRCVQRDTRLWGHVTWTNKTALARYKILSQEFETTKFSETHPLTFEAIPWPVLGNPFDLRVQHLKWNMVEGFFAFVRAEVGWTSVEYKNLVEKAHRIFHPDKWKSRGLLGTVPDEDLRRSLEVAGNVVAQALTPLWRRTKGYAND